MIHMKNFFPQNLQPLSREVAEHVDRKEWREAARSARELSLAAEHIFGMAIKAEREHGNNARG